MNAATPAHRIVRMLLDDGLAWILAGLAAAGSFTHIRDLAIHSGQDGWMANAIAVCIDLMCVMAVRERKRDQRLDRRCGRVTWPTVVLTLGICVTIAANLATAQQTLGVDHGRHPGGRLPHRSVDAGTPRQPSRPDREECTAEMRNGHRAR